MVVRVLRFLFFAAVVRAVVLIGLGVNVRHRERLPGSGPAIVVANHNSHLDTMVLMTWFPLRLLARLHPVAAADYFLSNRLLAWFALRIIGIVPLRREHLGRGSDPLAPVDEALAAGSVVILFPEGTRGEPEHLATLRTGIAHLAQRHPDLPVVPVFLHGLGKALPKGEALLVPFFCDVFVGEPVRWTGDRASYMEALSRAMGALAAEGGFAPWE